MLKEDEILALWDAIEMIIEPLALYLIKEITDRIINAGDTTRTARNQAARAAQMGVTFDDVKKYIKDDNKRSEAEIALIFSRCAELTWSGYSKVKAISESESLQQIIKAAIALGGEQLENITQTIGFVDPFGNYSPLDQIYQRCSGFAALKAATGTSYQEALRAAVKPIAENGVQTILYESGQRASLDVAVRRNIFGGMGLMVENLQQEAFDEIGADGWEVSAHEACAKDHEPYQGRQYTKAQFEALNGTKENPGILKRRFSTLNCKHIAFPIILGVNQPMYTAQDLQAMKDRNKKGIEYGGKHYTIYEATQEQRALERTIRKQKRKIAGLEGVGDDQALQNAKVRLTAMVEEYEKFSAAAKLRTQYQRLDALGLK